MLETDDFLHFKISTLNGPEVRNKGLALFPRKVNGHYAMLSRQDNENIYLMYSDMLHFWYTKELIAKPTYPWEFVQLGNCGSPIETEAGWLVLTHGVGPMRKYAMGAFLLDLDDPSRVIGRLRRAAACSRTPTSARATCRTSSTVAAASSTPGADHPLRHVRLRQHVRHRAGGPASGANEGRLMHAEDSSRFRLGVSRLSNLAMKGRLAAAAILYDT